MKIAITGSIATDHLMTFRGRFSDSLVPDQLSKISLSFLADELQIRRGGVAANISFGMAALGERPLLVGAVGEDFGSYRSWLERHGVDCESVLVSETKHTARFVCTTDDDQAQIATFYAGAMGEARDIELGPLASRVGGLDMVLVGANDPEAMRRHSEECRSRGIPFVADPSQQLAFADGPFIRELIAGASYLMTNEYEAHLTEQKTGWTGEQILEHVDVRVITRGRDGARILAKGAEPIDVPVAGAVTSVDPTGVGDGFRAGFLCGLSWNLDLVTCAQLGSTLATYVVETVGTQEYVLGTAHFLDRMARAYGDDAAGQVETRLGISRV